MKNENKYYVCVSEGLELQDEFFGYIGMLKDYLVEIAEDEIDRQFRELYPDRYSRMHVYLHNENIDYEYRLGKQLFRKGLLRHAVNETDATYLCEMYRWFSYHRKSKPFIQKSLLQFKLFVRNQKLSSSQQDVLRHVLRIVNGVRKLDDNIEPSQPSTVPQIKTPPPTSAQADYSLCLPQTQAATGVAVPDTTRAEQAYIEDSDGSMPRVEVVNQLTIENMKEAVRHGVREGLLDTDALTQKERQKEIQTRQENFLLVDRSPAEVSRILERDPAKQRLRAQRISNERNDQKKKPK